ncbi:MAG TPA: hypothetical protein DDW90_01865 [Cyanobacteria bacterium UBA9971]|nr:hypothetical protein [Cyanobacteria bacterium UBA9971]
MLLKKGDILFLDIEFSDKSGYKERPVVLISKHNNELNYLENDEFALNLLKSNYFLPKDSFVKLWKIGTIDESILPDNIAVLDKLKLDDLNKIIEKLNNYFSQDW